MDEIDTALSVLLSLRIANLGYAVGMGQPPNPKTVREIARAARLTVLRGMLGRELTQAQVDAWDCAKPPDTCSPEEYKTELAWATADFRAVLSAEIAALEKEGRTP